MIAHNAYNKMQFPYYRLFLDSPVVDFATAVSTNIDAWFNCYCNQLGEAFEESGA